MTPLPIVRMDGFLMKVVTFLYKVHMIPIDKTYVKIVSIKAMANSGVKKGLTINHLIRQSTYL